MEVKSTELKILRDFYSFEFIFPFIFRKFSKITYFKNTIFKIKILCLIVICSKNVQKKYVSKKNSYQS